MKERVELQCANCPKRSRLGRMLGRIAGDNTVADNCTGKVEVTRAEVAMEEYGRSEKLPPSRRYEPRFYSSVDLGRVRVLHTSWGSTEVVCGREDITTADDEAILPAATGKNGTRAVNVVKGDEDALSSLGAFIGTIELLDASARLDNAVDAGDSAAIAGAENEIQGMGLERLASATSDDTEL